MLAIYTEHNLFQRKWSTQVGWIKRWVVGEVVHAWVNTRVMSFEGVEEGSGSRIKQSKKESWEENNCLIVMYVNGVLKAPFTVFICIFLYIYIYISLSAHVSIYLCPLSFLDITHTYLDFDVF